MKSPWGLSAATTLVIYRVRRKQEHLAIMRDQLVHQPIVVLSTLSDTLHETTAANTRTAKGTFYSQPDRTLCLLFPHASH